MSVPLPTPLGPVTTSTVMRPRLSAQVGNELAALALGQAADRLRGRDPALGQDAVHLHAPVLRDRQQQVEDLGRLQVFRRVQKETLDLGATGFEVPLERGSARADLVRPLKRIHALRQRALGSRTRRLLRRGLGGGGRHAARLYTWEGDRQPAPTLFLANSPAPLPELESGWGYLTLFAALCRAFVIQACTQTALAGKKPRSSREMTASSSAIRRPASGSRKLSVPTATQRAPTARKSRASRPDAMPPMPIAGIATREQTALSCARAIARTAGPDTPPLPAPSHGSPLRGSNAMPFSVLIRETASAPASSAALATAAGSVAFGVSFTISGLAVSGRRRSTARAVSLVSAPMIRPVSTLGHEKLSSTSATSSRS